MPPKHKPDDGSKPAVSRPTHSHSRVENDRDAEGSNLNAYVDLGPDMCGAGAVGTNDDCADRDFPTDFPCPNEGLRSREVCVRLVGRLVWGQLGRVSLRQRLWCWATRQM